MAKIVITTTSLRLSLASFCLKSKKNHAKRPIMSLRTGTARLMNKNSYIVINVKLGFTVVVCFFFNRPFLLFFSIWNENNIQYTHDANYQSLFRKSMPFLFFVFLFGGGVSPSKTLAFVRISSLNCPKFTKTCPRLLLPCLSKKWLGYLNHPTPYQKHTLVLFRIVVLKKLKIPVNASFF